jgi:hypothetical protein
VLRHQDGEGLARFRPLLQVLVRGAVQRRRQEDRAFHLGRHRFHCTVHQGQFGAEGPPHQPPVGQAPPDGEAHGGLDVVLFADALLEGAGACAVRRGRSAGIEPQHGDACQGRQTVGGLAVDMRVHEPAVGGERMQGDQRGMDRPFFGQRQFPNQGVSVVRLQLHVFAPRGQDRGGTDGNRGAGGAEFIRRRIKSHACQLSDSRGPAARGTQR